MPGVLVRLRVRMRRRLRHPVSQERPGIRASLNTCASHTPPHLVGWDVLRRHCCEVLQPSHGTCHAQILLCHGAAAGGNAAGSSAGAGARADERPVPAVPALRVSKAQVRLKTGLHSSLTSAWRSGEITQSPAQPSAAAANIFCMANLCRCHLDTVNVWADLVTYNNLTQALQVRQQAHESCAA